MGRVDLDGIVGLAERRHGAFHVARIAGGNLSGDLCRGRLVHAGLHNAAAAAGIERGGQEELDIGIWEDDRPDVAALHDAVDGRAKDALPVDERGADGGNGADLGGGFGDLGGSDGLCDIFAGEEDAVESFYKLEVDGERAGDLAELFVGARGEGIDASAVPLEGHAAVHGAGVDESEAEPLGEESGDGAFACARGAIHCDNHAWLRSTWAPSAMSASTKPG